MQLQSHCTTSFQRLFLLCVFLTEVHMAGAFTVPASVDVGKNAQRCCVQSQTQARCASFLRSGLHAASTRTVEFKRSVHGPAVLRMADKTAETTLQILPLYDGRNLIIGENGWYLESSIGADELSGDFAVPLEMNDEQRGEFTEWILYKDGEVMTTVTEDEIDAANDALMGMTTNSLTNPIGPDLKTGAGGFVLGALASMVGLFGKGEASGDSGSGFRLFGNFVGLRANENDDTWALWDVERASKQVASPTTPTAKTRTEDVTNTLAAEQVQLEQLAGEDAEWIASRREGTMLLREAEATMKQGDFDQASRTCQGAIALFRSEVARGVGPTAEELLARAFAAATAASEGDQKQAEARSEAMRLANEAEQWLKNGDLETALIMAGRAQEALNEVELFFGRISAEELTRVLEIKVRVQEKLQMRAMATSTILLVPAATSQKRAALEQRQRQKLVDKKKEDARMKRRGQGGDGQDMGSARGDAQEEEWREDKDLGATLDRAARQALKDGKCEDAAQLARRAVECFRAAGSKGFKRAETEAKGSQNVVDRAMASNKVQQAKAAAAEVEQDGQAAKNLADQNAELEVLFAFEAIGAELSQSSEDSSPADWSRKEAVEVTVDAMMAAANVQNKKEEDMLKAKAAAQAKKLKENAAVAKKQKEEKEEAKVVAAAAAEAKRDKEELARVEAELAEAKMREETERSRKEAEDKVRSAAEAQREAAAAVERVKVEMRAVEARAQRALQEQDRKTLKEAEDTARQAVEAAARAKVEEERLRKQEREEEAKAATEALARMRARKAAKESAALAKEDSLSRQREQDEAAAQTRAQEAAAAEQTARAEEEEKARADEDARRQQEEAARRQDEARRTLKQARAAEMTRAQEKAAHDKAAAARAPVDVYAEVYDALKPRTDWRGDVVISPDAGNAARQTRRGGLSGSPSLRSMGGTRMVDLSNPDSDPTVRKIVAEKFFGSGTGREKKEVIGVKRYEMDVKYHGILLGKKGVTVKALEKASGATIRFETSPQGALIIMGTDNQRQVAWKLITSVQATLPKILSQIRDQNIRPGELKTIPSFEGRVVNQDQVWPVAVNEAIIRAKQESEEQGDSSK